MFEEYTNGEYEDTMIILSPYSGMIRYIEFLWI